MIAAIVTHYQGTQSDEQLVTCVADILPQIAGGSVHVLHDGPLLRQWPPGTEGAYLHATPVRKNVWGHNLRRLGLLWSAEDYVWFTNADNRLYPGALDAVRATLPGDGALFGIRDYYIKGDSETYRDLPALDDHGRDCMQAVFHRKLWMAHDAWVSEAEAIDGHLIRTITETAQIARIPQNYGEHH